uniref:hypothetical protein n=1 Tax=Streptomyces achromogenes TaxID=67255 RepID=UPI003F4912D1
MPVRRARPLPFITVPREVLLNDSLSPTSRLLYATLLATLDGEVDFSRIASLTGVQDSNDLAPYLDELAAVGAVEMGDHEGRGSVLTVHEMPVLPQQRTHACVPCEDCGECSCEYIKGVCRSCSEIRSTNEQARRDITRYKRQLEAGATYAIGQHAARLHRWDCPTLNTPEKGMARLEEQKPYAAHGGYYWSRLPDLYTAEELRRKGTKKKHCATCGPDPL